MSSLLLHLGYNGSTFLSDDGPAAFNYNNDFGTNRIGGPQSVGGGIFPSLFSWVYEVQAQVHPSNFSYPYTGRGDDDAQYHDPNYNHLHLARDVEAHFYNNSNVFQPDKSKEWSVYPATANDTDRSAYQSDNTSPMGYIYNIDGPGPNNSSASGWGVGEIRRMRFNGREYAEILAQGKPTRCSLIAGFYIRLSAVNKGNGNFQASSDQSNDNTAGLGVTSVTASP